MKTGNSAEGERSRSGYASIMDMSRRSGRGAKPLAPLNIRGGSGETELKREIPAYNAEETPIRDETQNERTESRDDLHAMTSLDSTVHRKSLKLKSLGDKKLLSRKDSPDSAKKLLRKSRLAAVEETIVGLTVSLNTVCHMMYI